MAHWHKSVWELRSSSACLKKICNSRSIFYFTKSKHTLNVVPSTQTHRVAISIKVLKEVTKELN